MGILGIGYCDIKTYRGWFGFNRLIVKTQKDEMKMKTKLWASAAAAAAVIGIGVGGYFMSYSSGASCGSSAIAGGKATIGGPFTLVNAAGETVTDQDIIKGMTLVYFGYTFCPDICPLDIQRNVTAVDIAAESGVDIQPVFIPIDPERDTPEVVGDFASNNHDRLIGLTGSAEQISAASKAYKTFYRKNGDGEDYLIDHSVFSYLVDQNGFIDFFRRDMSPEEMAKSLVCYSQS
jgi:protein SCO1/2